MTALKHEWRLVQFSYATWTECECGFRPDNETEFDQHNAEHSIPVGEKHP